ncbi:MAG: hypothetical protein M3M94_02320, partial [Actinomycetota bacterium]|nr:hypothetical protein [Actinomycetota bacterium]
MASVLAEQIEELRADREHGASWMARRAVEALLDVADEPAPSGEALLERLIEAGRELAESRPGVASVAGAVGRVLAAAHGLRHLDAADLRRVVHEEAAAVLDARRRAARSIAIQLRSRVSGAVVVTHSASATVREALVYGRPERVVCTVSQPQEEGRAFAENLRSEGLDVVLVADEDAPAQLETAALFLVGADTVYRDGTLCNKIGTHELARAAAEEGVPVVVACEVIKLVPVDAADAPPLEEEAELFDLTPAELIDEIVTEEGAVWSDEVRSLIDRTPF